MFGYSSKTKFIQYIYILMYAELLRFFKVKIPLIFSLRSAFHHVENDIGNKYIAFASCKLWVYFSAGQSKPC